MSRNFDSKIASFVSGRAIKNCILDNESSIYISYENEINYLQLDAYADCCSESWFETYNDIEFDSIISKEIKSIECGENVDMPESGRQYYDQNDTIIVQFIDDTTFTFLLRNSSNGYYSGWLEMSIC